MTYPSVKETIYTGETKGLAVFVVPHGAAADEFLEAFPEILAHREVQALLPLFMSYLAIERDLAASDLAHALAHRVQRRLGLTSIVAEVNYPRGIIDGGRKIDHSLRPCLPSGLSFELKDAFLQVHRHTLDYMGKIYQRITAENGYLLDVHTMANFCPTDSTGQRSTIPVSFPRLEDYVEQFLNAGNVSYQRKIDLITSDEKGEELAAPEMRRALSQAMEQGSFPYAINEPYLAASAYLSHQHMKSVRGISIDVPKYLLTYPSADGGLPPLDELAVDPDRVEALADCLVKAWESLVT